MIWILTSRGSARMIVKVVISSTTRVPEVSFSLSTLLRQPTTYLGPLLALTITETAEMIFHQFHKGQKPTSRTRKCVKQTAQVHNNFTNSLLIASIVTTEMLKHKTLDQLLKIRRNKVSITAFIVKRPENFAYDLANTLKGLEIIFSFTEFLFCSPQVLSHCIKPNLKSVTYTKCKNKITGQCQHFRKCKPQIQDDQIWYRSISNTRKKNYRRLQKSVTLQDFIFIFIGSAISIHQSISNLLQTFWVKAVPNTSYQFLSNKFRSFD